VTYFRNWLDLDGLLSLGWLPVAAVMFALLKLESAKGRN
jgi:hypothetical protein